MKTLGWSFVIYFGVIAYLACLAALEKSLEWIGHTYGDVAGLSAFAAMMFGFVYACVFILRRV